MTAMTEEERKYYNDKLIKDGLKDELSKPHRFDLKDLIKNVIGITTGFMVTHALDIRNFVLEVLILTAGICIVHGIVYLFEEYILRKKTV